MKTDIKFVRVQSLYFIIILFSLMLSSNLLFYLFSTFLVISALMVILTSHPVFSLLFLVGSFLAASSILLLLECEFLALLFITIYVGAIAILLLFAVMMLEFKQSSLIKSVTKYLPAGTIFGFVLSFFLFNSISNYFPESIITDDLYKDNFINWYDLIDSTSESEVLGHVLYSYFVIQFLVVGLILLVVLFGVVHLTNNFNRVRTGYQSMFKQLSKNIDLKK